MLRRHGTNAIDRLVILRVRLPANGETDAGLRHQIAFVGGINEYLCAIDLAILHHDFRDARAVLLHRGKALSKMDRHFGRFEHLKQNGFRHMRFKGPLGGAGRIHFSERRASAVLRKIRRAFLKPPRAVRRIMLSDTLVKFARDSADGRFIADVRRAEPARGHTAQILAELGNDGAPPHARGLHRGHHPARRAAVDAKIGGDDCGRLSKLAERQNYEGEPGLENSRAHPLQLP